MQDIFTRVLPYVDYTINIEKVKDGKVEDNYVPYSISFPISWMSREL